VLISVSGDDKRELVDTAREFVKLGFRIKATDGTHEALQKAGVPSEVILKLHQGRPNILDAVTNREIQLVINTPVGKLSQYDDSYIRKAAIKAKVPYITTAAAAAAAAKGIAARKAAGTVQVRSLQEYHAGLK